MASVDKSLEQQCPSLEFSRPPRSILHHSYWKVLTHLPKYVTLWGPLWIHSAFGFESYNGHLTSMITLSIKLVSSFCIPLVCPVLTEQLEGIESEETLDFLNLQWNSHRSNMIQIDQHTHTVGPLSAASVDELFLIQNLAVKVLMYKCSIDYT